MARVCHNCGKGPGFGNPGATRWSPPGAADPNLQKVRILEGGAKKRGLYSPLPEANKVTKSRLNHRCGDAAQDQAGITGKHNPTGSISPVDRSGSRWCSAAVLPSRTTRLTTDSRRSMRLTRHSDPR